MFAAVTAHYLKDTRFANRAIGVFLVTVFGALAMLVGFISVFAQTHTFDST